MTEGCQGGWGIMNGYFAENVALYSETCAPYVGKGKTCSALGKAFVEKKCVEVAKVTKSYNVEPTEKGIQKELLKNGMVDIGWSFPESANMIKYGILKQNAPIFLSSS